MDRKRIVLILVLGFVLLLGGAYFLYDRLGSQVERDQLGGMDVSSQGQQEGGSASVQGSASQSTAGGEEQTEALAPDFRVYDAEGNAVNLHDFFGKPVVVNFWASWCGPCKSEMPEFDEAYAKYGGEIHFLMVNMTDGSRETQESAEEYLSGCGYSFPVYYDKDLSAAVIYGVYSLPTTYFIDAEGNGIAYANGAIDLATLERGIGMILPS